LEFPKNIFLNPNEEHKRCGKEVKCVVKIISKRERKKEGKRIHVCNERAQ